jgi:hypothetical protein
MSKILPPAVKTSKIFAFSRETSKKFRLHRNAGAPLKEVRKVLAVIFQTVLSG